MYNSKVYNSENFYKLDDSIKEIPIIKNQIEKVKQNEIEQHNLKSIKRNKNNQAIIVLNDLECIVDDNRWHE